MTDLVDVEPLRGQHDSGLILVGPLLSLSINSGYRYFYIAGNGSKVYETISLGFVEVETNAQTQRAEFIEKLESRFAEVLTFDSLPEIAHAVHTRWPKEETAKFLAFAKLEAKPQLMPVPGPAPTLVPSGQPPRGDRAVTKQRHSGLSQDDIAAAILRLTSPAKLGAVPKLPVDELGGVPKVPVEGARSLASIMLRFCAVGCAVALVATLVAWAMVRSSTWQVADEAAPAPVPAPSVSVGRNKDSSQAAAAVPPSVPNQLTEANEPAPQVVPAPATVPPSPPSQPSQVASVQAGTAPVSGPQSLPAPSTARRLDAEEIATLVNRGTDLMKSGDLALARLLLRRAAEAGSASAALMLGTTFDPLVIQQLGAIGVVPDVAQARQWYEKAAALGSDAASQRLAKLPQTGH